MSEDKKILEDKFRGCFFGMVLGEMAVPLPGQAPAPSILSPRMSLALYTGEVLAGRKKDVPFGAFLAGKYLEWSQSGHVGDAVFEEAIQHLKQGESWKKSGVSSVDSEVLFRATLTGLSEFTQPVDDIKKHALDSALIIENDRIALAAAQAQAFAVAYLIHTEELNILHLMQELIDLTDEVSTCFADELRALVGYMSMDSEWVLNLIQPKASALECLPAALFCFIKSPENFPVTLNACLKGGEGAQIVASLAGSLSGAYLGAQKIPQELRNRVPEQARINGVVNALLEKSITK